MQNGPRVNDVLGVRAPTEPNCQGVKTNSKRECQDCKNCVALGSQECKNCVASKSLCPRLQNDTQRANFNSYAQSARLRRHLGANTLFADRRKRSPSKTNLATLEDLIMKSR
ncbi:hypothetical protein Ddc_18602 [Ditylenchus destructor]|nr:hypothetical protein Ddc_18602 [Ditylenchus destructor]